MLYAVGDAVRLCMQILSTGTTRLSARIKQIFCRYEIAKSARLRSKTNHVKNSKKNPKTGFKLKGRILRIQK